MRDRRGAPSSAFLRSKPRAASSMQRASSAGVKPFRSRARSRRRRARWCPTIRRNFSLDEALMKVARLALVLRHELLGVSRALQSIEEIAISRFKLRDHDVGQSLAGPLLAATPRSARLRARFAHGFDDGAKERLLRVEVVIERLPGQAAFLGDELHRGEPVAILSEHLGGGIEDAVARRHLSILTDIDGMSTQLRTRGLADGASLAKMGAGANAGKLGSQ